MTKRKHSVFTIISLISFTLTLLLGNEEFSFAGSKFRKYYLTKDLFMGSQALTACDEGYHMASLYEIFEPTFLKYDTEKGLTTDDSGFGPPTASILGWIRTGFFSNGSFDEGAANCLAWTSNSGDDVGTRAGLTQFWDNPPSSRIDPWQSSLGICDDTYPVWCVQD